MVTKKTEDQLFIGAIKSVLNKHLFFDPCLPATVFKNHIARKNENEIMAMSLDEMEIDIIKLVCRNFNEEMIASEINRSVDTVEGRIKKIATKLNTSGIRGVALAAIKIGMVSPEHISAEPHAREKNNHEPKSKK